MFENVPHRVHTGIPARGLAPGTSGARDVLQLSGGRLCALIGAPWRLSMLSTLSTCSSILSEGKSTPRQGTPMRAYFQSPEIAQRLQTRRFGRRSRISKRHLAHDSACIMGLIHACTSARTPLLRPSLGAHRRRRQGSMAVVSTLVVPLRSPAL